MSRESAVKVAPWLVIPIAAALIALGATRERIDNKEDKTTHKASIDSVWAHLRQQRLRDSVVYETLLDVLCNTKIDPDNRKCGS